MAERPTVPSFPKAVPRFTEGLEVSLYYSPTYPRTQLLRSIGNAQAYLDLGIVVESYFL